MVEIQRVAANSGTASNWGRIPRFCELRRYEATVRPAAARGEAPEARQARKTNTNVPPVSAPLSRTTLFQPPARYTAARTAWASHCWSVHPAPGAENVNVSTRGSVPCRISSPRRM